MSTRGMRKYTIHPTYYIKHAVYWIKGSTWWIDNYAGRLMCVYRNVMVPLHQIRKYHNRPTTANLLRTTWIACRRDNDAKEIMRHGSCKMHIKLAIWCTTWTRRNRSREESEAAHNAQKCTQCDAIRGIGAFRQRFGTHFATIPPELEERPEKINGRTSLSMLRVYLAWLVYFESGSQINDGEKEKWPLG